MRNNISLQALRRTHRVIIPGCVKQILLGTLFAILNRMQTETVRAPETLPSITPLALTCPSGFEAYLAILGVSKAALKPAKLPTF